MASPGQRSELGADAAATRLPELRKDPLTNRWVIFSPARAKRPTDFKSKSPQNPNPANSSCPFCIGREDECAPEIFRIPDESEWRFRVIENLYPALSRKLESQWGEVEDPGEGKGSSGKVLTGFGFHDVVIETPFHSVQLSDMAPRDVGDVLLAYKKRIEQIARFNSIQYVQVFKNHGASAGASMSHSHSQMIALPVLPPTVVARLDGMKQYFNQTGQCSLCEMKPRDLTIDESSYFTAIVPYAATFPFEIWIIPKCHSSHFHNLNVDQAVDLGGLLKLMLRKVETQLNNPPFNFMIHTSPLHATGSELPYIHWFLQIVPQLTVLAGFELGTGCYINPVFPEDAAKVFREVKIPT